MILRNPHRDHVLLDVLAEVNPCIEASRNNVNATVVGDDVENHIRIIARELRQFWPEDSRSGKSRNEQRTQPAGLSRNSETSSRAC